MDFLIAGLGNPGGRYRATRHNVGFRVAELLASRHGADAERSKHGGLLQEIRLPGGETLALFRPQEFMNVSGGPVARAAKAYGLGPEQIVAVHDDLESPFGRVRGTTACARSPSASARATSCASGSGSDGRVAAIAATSPTGCCRRSSSTRIPIR
jgi:PTH1 family peptidyl-tRNA hydrolase